VNRKAVQTGRYLLSPEASKRTLADLIDRYTEHVLPDLPLAQGTTLGISAGGRTSSGPTTSPTSLQVD
jgi:hypothetical protein